MVVVDDDWDTLERPFYKTFPNLKNKRVDKFNNPDVTINDVGDILAHFTQHTGHMFGESAIIEHCVDKHKLIKLLDKCSDCELKSKIIGELL